MNNNYNRRPPRRDQNTSYQTNDFSNRAPYDERRKETSYIRNDRFSGQNFDAQNQDSASSSRWDSLKDSDKNNVNNFSHQNESYENQSYHGRQYQHQNQNQNPHYHPQHYPNKSPRVNKFNLYGNTNHDERYANSIFNKEGNQTTGINFDKYDSIPVEVDGTDIPQPLDEFTIDNIGEQLIQNVQMCKFDKPTPVQKYAIPIGKHGRDLMACAQTGSGKTAGFLIPLIFNMVEFGPPSGRIEATSAELATPISLVLAPTRELVSQIFEQAQKFCYATGVRPVAVYGGTKVFDQLNQFQRGCDLLVATPGRLVDLVEQGRISLEFVKYVVLDEADRMLDMGFEPQIRRIIEQERMPVERQTFMFSATFPRTIQRLASDFLKDYLFLTVGTVGSASQDVIQRVVWVEEHKKNEYLMDLLGTMEEGLILIFVATKRGVDDLFSILEQESFPVVSIHGDKDQKERERALQTFKNGEVPILIATDVAARGLDIPNVAYVINYDLPSNIEDYVHRIGRTGRVGHIGTSVSFLNETTNKNIVMELFTHLDAHNQECPEWLNEMVSFLNSRGRNKVTTDQQRGNGQFASRDYRKPRGSNSFRDGFDQRDRNGNGNRRGGSNGGYPSRGNDQWNNHPEKNQFSSYRSDYSQYSNANSNSKFGSGRHSDNYNPRSNKNDNDEYW